MYTTNILLTNTLLFIKIQILIIWVATCKGVNPGGDGGDISPPCFDMGGITCLLSPPCFDPQICVFLVWKINNVL